MIEDSPTAGQKFDRLVEIMAKLRSPGGCPWDREQTFESIQPYLLEETYEVMEAIDARNWDGLAEELGDLLLQSVFFAQMASEEGLFSIEDSVDAINEKLIRRHPHVFAGVNAETAEDVKRNWDQIKANEKLRKGGANTGSLGSVSRTTPALVEAQAISSKAASVGFDWENIEQVIEKLHEELNELKAARANAKREAIADEIGDLLCVVVNLARHLKVDAEQALRRTNSKFRKRFGYIERVLEQRGKTPEESSLQEMESLWQEAKRAAR